MKYSKYSTLSLDARGVLHSWNKEPVIKNAELSSDLECQPKSVLFHQEKRTQNCFLVNRGRLKLTKLNE